ncbi:MAG: hypothetical protein L6M37_03960 [Candidatus Methylarchaceae archaeon HK02M1]|nr:hypothetical protein [Candidatus Methylarchaceae archaeon HK01M]MCP8312094.1 hypothetical protein [Candidatus Methylarchaceae archaeon HK02M1]
MVFKIDVEQIFKVIIVNLILSKRPEKALELISKHYSVEVPKLKVGMPKRHRKVIGCYVEKTNTIHVSNQDALYNPYVILHEFYHHLRTHDGVHRGTEKYANKFSKDYIDVYKEYFHNHSI